MSRRLHILALVVLSLGSPGCAISEDEEVQLGVAAAEQVEAQVPLVSDPLVERYVQALGEAVARQADDRELEWRFRVVDSRIVNAFALPGGFVYVNRGLIERATTMSELAGVLGHEIAHITERHSVEQMQKAQRANAGLVVLCTLTSVCESGIAQTAIQVGGSAWFAKHSREDEREADSVGVEHVVQAGIDPRGVPAFFETLLAERRREPALVEAWFGSHPLEEERIQRTRRLIRALDPALLRNAASDSPAFQAMRDRLRVLPPPPEPDPPLEQ